MIGGNFLNDGDNLDFSRYLYFEISATTNTSVTYNSITTGLTSGDIINLRGSGDTYLTFFESIDSNPDIVVKAIVRLTSYIENNPTKSVSIRSGLEPLGGCCPYEPTPPFDPNEVPLEINFLVTENGNELTDELSNNLIT